jgi:hypothetical protein
VPGGSIRQTKRDAELPELPRFIIEELQPPSKMSQITNSAILAIPSGCDDPSGGLILGLCGLFLRLPDFTFGMVFVCHADKHDTIQRPKATEFRSGSRQMSGSET